MYQGSEPSAPLTVMLDTAVKFRGADIFKEKSMKYEVVRQIGEYKFEKVMGPYTKFADAEKARLSYFRQEEIGQMRVVCDDTGDALKAIEKTLARYEAVRGMTPLKFGELYRMNMKTGRAFDDLVDDLIEGRLSL